MPTSRVFLHCIWLAFLLCPHVGNTQPSEITSLQATALDAGLYEHPVWRQLMHYQRSPRSPSGIESQIDDKRFFLSVDGKTDPKSELLATIDQLLVQSAGSVGNEHPRCRFVSRESWVRTKLSLPARPVPDTCNEYREWRAAVGSQSMSLVFPASYLNSPSSMFGHTLLRFDPEGIEQGSEWLSWSLNFAAETGEENFSAGYALKGIAGGYAGKFNSVPYFKKLQEYGAIENRDIWEYRLDFTPDELEKMLDHAWELRDINFDYYFFRQNCSYRLLELMDYARPDLKLADQFRVTTIPADTIKAVAKAGIVKETIYRPSLGTGIQARYQALPSHLRHWVDTIANNPNKALEKKFTELDVLERARIVRVANDLLTYRSRHTERSAKVAKNRLAMLKMISELPVEQNTIERPRPPELSHDTRSLSLGRGKVAKESYTEFSLRWSYHDILDRSYGYLNGAGIVLGDIRLRKFDQDSAQLQSLGLVKLQSLSDRALIFNTLSWDLSVGFERNVARNNNRLAAHATGSIGKSTKVFRKGIGYALLGASMSQYSRAAENYVDARLQLGTLYYHKSTVLQLELELESAKNESLRTSAVFNYNLPLATNHALRFSYSVSTIRSQRENIGSIEYRMYF